VIVLPKTYLYVSGNNKTARKIKIESYLLTSMFLLIEILGILFILMKPYSMLYFILGLALIVLSSINIPIPAIIGYRIKGGCSIPFRKKTWLRLTKKYYQDLYYISYQINIKLLGGVSN